MYAATTSVALIAGDARPVEVQVHVGRQQESFRLSGLPDVAVREAKDRVRSAIVSTGIRFPNRAVTVNLAPAHLPKRGTDFDLPIALGVLAASGELPSPHRVVVVGELALDGSIRPGFGSLGAAVLSARGEVPCLVAAQVAREVSRVPNSQVYGVASLADAVDCLRGGLAHRAPAVPDEDGQPMRDDDLSDVQGQPLAKRALEIAAAGSHHFLMHGPPGGGKTMLARRLPGILPPLGDDESVEVALIHGAAGLRVDLGLQRPFRAPHHTASRAALVGGGSGIPVPGEVSLAHRGVLFLDELAEFPRGHLDTLRQPLEEGEVTIARRGVTVRFPARFHLVAASNPCPCGFLGDDRMPCECRPSQVGRYRQRLSGPLLDRVDLVVRVGRVETMAFGATGEERSETVRRRVLESVAFGHQSRGLLGEEAARTILTALEKGLVTARGATVLRRVARTIANLEASDEVRVEHVAEAMGFRRDW